MFMPVSRFSTELSEQTRNVYSYRHSGRRPKCSGHLGHRPLYLPLARQGTAASLLGLEGGRVFVLLVVARQNGVVGNINVDNLQNSAVLLQNDVVGYINVDNLQNSAVLLQNGVVGYINVDNLQNIA